MYDWNKQYFTVRNLGMLCNKCGVENDDQANFCSGCGLNFMATRWKHKLKSRNIWYLSIMISVLLIIGFIFTLAENQFLLPGKLPNNGLETEKNFYKESEKSTVILEAQSSVYTIYTEDGGMGSGFLYEDKGTVVTNAHVVVGFTEVTVRNYMGQETTGKVIGISDFFDIALIQVDDYAGEKPLEREDAYMTIGTEVIAIGSPDGWENSASIGYISGVDRILDDIDYNYSNVYQIDAHIAPGSSGGPLLDANTGKVIGINTGILVDNSFAFSIPITSINTLLQKWSNSPMTTEEVASIEPSIEYDETVMEETVLEETDLINFIHSFRSNYEMAINQEQFWYIEDMLEYDSLAYDKLDDFITQKEGKGTKLELISNKVTGVVIEESHAIVSTIEEYNFLSPLGVRTPFKREREYRVVIDQYDLYTISDISLYD